MRRLILGGGGCQLNLIRRAKERGEFVIVADYLKNCPGAALADAHAKVSTFDAEGVLRAAREFKAQSVVTLGTDQPVLTAARVAEALKLPFYVDVHTALAVTNKRVMKSLFLEHGIPTLNYVLLAADFDEAELKSFRFPAVLKPVDSQGQRGIFRVESIAEVKRHIAETLSFSREDRALLEEFYPNDEITVNGWLDKGRLTVLSVVDRVTIKNTKHIGICLCHNFPSVHLKRYHGEITALTERIVRAFKLENGPIYFQYLVGDRGIKVNEIAARIGGAYEDLTLPHIAGIDALSLLLDLTGIGRCDTGALEGYDMMKRGRFVSTQLYFFKPGRLASVTPDAAMLACPGVLHAKGFYCAGDTVPETENATARAGYLIVEGSGFKNMLQNVNDAFLHMKALDPMGNDLVIRYEDYPDKYLFADPNA
ncbi:MAG: ATP-grasp domain-containing protein [Clostridiaceae bacterium]|nr:ATP-grasp domain-containing protein [Eubacteriales bacterium]